MNLDQNFSQSITDEQKGKQWQEEEHECGLLDETLGCRSCEQCGRARHIEKHCTYIKRE